MNEIPVFVYGTLRGGGSNHHRMGDSIYLGKGRVAGVIYWIDWNPSLVYPALLCGGSGWVQGELFLVSEDCLEELDAFEGVVPSEDDDYRRVEVEVLMEDGTEKTAWVWEWQGELGGAEILEDGDWLNHEPDPR